MITRIVLAPLLLVGYVLRTVIDTAIRAVVVLGVIGGLVYAVYWLGGR